MVQNDSTLHKKYLLLQQKLKDKNYTDALGEGLILLESAQKKNEQKMVILLTYFLGEVFEKTDNNIDAMKYYKKSYAEILKSRSKFNSTDQYLKSSFNDVSLAERLIKIGGLFHKLEKKDSAKVFYNKIINLESLNKEIEAIQAKAYSNLSFIFQVDNNFSSAEEYSLKAIDIHRKYNNSTSLASAHINLGNIYVLKGEYEEAKKIYNKGLKYIKYDKGERATKFKEDLYYNLAYALYMLKDYKAYEYQELSYSIKDSVREENNKTKLAAILAKYDVNVAKRMVQQEEALKREKVINQKQKAQRNTWILGISSFFVIVLLVFLLNQYKLRQKNLGLELSKQELMQQQKMEKIKAESQIRILNATLDGKESERKQIAETLHDSVSALLSSANLHLQACKKQFNGTTPIEVDKSQSIINEASQKIRDLSHTLVSSILLKFGLSYAIKDISEKFSNSQLRIDYETRYIKRYDQGFEIKLYNIIQEFVNNILKHSKASYAKITLVEKKNRLHLIIEDDGQGFDKTQIPKKDGLGINQIDARIQMMQGKFNIDTGKGKGTVITIELPVFEKEAVTFS
ncbi:tetratricopeptide repeat-containing sensor histidine kinase [Pseudotenacibaculum haliotis]|uniref:histidine kinase n=1 Tax=Pseudotenacibaculum haliotis TaxID=1862138 RepID=A0ABW5LVP0_9FLAO